MSRTTTVGSFFLVGSLLCCAFIAKALKAQDAGEIAGQSVVGVDDNAVTVEGRREALRKLEEAIGLFISTGENQEAARALNRIGRLHLKLNALEAAVDSHQKALSLLKATPNPQLEVDSLNGLAEAYLILKKRDQVEEILQRSLSLSERSGYTRGQAQALLTLSDKQNYDNHAVAVQTAQQALLLWQSLNDRAGIARSYSQIALCLMAQNQVHEAGENYESALQIWRELKDRSEQAEILILLGLNEERKAEWQNAISYFTEAQTLVDEQAEPRKMGQISAGLADAFNRNGLPENGLVHYQRSLDYYRLTRDPHLIWYATWGLGWTYSLLGNYPEAEAHLREALKDMAEESLETAATSVDLGILYIATGKYSEARQHLQKALAILTRAGNQLEAAQVRALLGQIHQHEGQLELARQYYKQALGTFQDLTAGLDQAAVCYALGRLELKARNLDAAEEYLRQSIDLTEKIRRVPASGDLTAAYSPTVHERYESYIECLMHKHRGELNQGFAVRAFEISELARARSLTELLRATQTTIAPGVDPQLAAQEKSVRQSIRLAEDERVSFLSKAYKKEDLDAVTVKLAQLETEYKQITDAIRARYPSSEQIISPTALSLRQIQEQVLRDDQTVLLEYSLGEDKSYVWAVTRNDIKSYELPTEARINEAAQKVYRLLTTADPAKSEAELSEATRELGQMVLSPVAAELNMRRMIVVADGALHYIPFQILPASSATDQPLVATTEVINTPSASILGQLQQEMARRQTPTKVLAAFGDPVFASNYAQRKQTDTGAKEYIASVSPEESGRWRHALRDIELAGDSVNPSTLQSLFYTTHELANLREVAGPETLMVTSFEATREKLASLDLTQYAILHFATHGVLDPKRPENSGLFLSMVNREGQEQNGFVGLQDIYNLHAPVELVVLSACRTGLGKDVRGEGLIGLTRGFMYAGASSVVASLWKVDDEATSELMKQFYSNMLQRGMTPASALRVAQNSIRQQPQWRSPYYWAAFTLQGDSSRVIKTAPIRWMPVWLQVVFGLSLLLLLGMAAIWYRRSRLAKSRR
jgi:CHAT domain-containing protein/uncharacterized protein HemY